VVDPLGRVIKSLPLGAEGVLDAPLPQGIAPTPYARAGDGPAGLLVGLAFLWVMRSRRAPSKGRRTAQRDAHDLHAMHSCAILLCHNFFPTRYN
jgi:hypothetical protein